MWCKFDSHKSQNNVSRGSHKAKSTVFCLGDICVHDMNVYKVPKDTGYIPIEGYTKQTITHKKNTCLWACSCC